MYYQINKRHTQGFAFAGKYNRHRNHGVYLLFPLGKKAHKDKKEEKNSNRKYVVLVSITREISATRGVAKELQGV